MKSIAWIRRPYIYIFAAFIVCLLVIEYTDFNTDISGLRWIAISLATIAGILIGLVAVMVATIVQISLSQKQFYQGLLANESKWLEGWFATHPTIYAQLKDEEEIFYAIYRHSAIPKFSEEEILKKMDKTMYPLTERWRKRVKEAPYECHIKQGEIEEFEKHLVGIGATLGRIKASKDRVILGKHLSDVLWPLGFDLLIALIVILLCSITNIATYMSDNASMFALGLILIAVVSVFPLILVVSLYIRTEVKDMRRVGPLKEEKSEALGPEPYSLD